MLYVIPIVLFFFPPGMLTITDFIYILKRVYKAPDVSEISIVYSIAHSHYSSTMPVTVLYFGQFFCDQIGCLSFPVLCDVMSRYFSTSFIPKVVQLISNLDQAQTKVSAYISKFYLSEMGSYSVLLWNALFYLFKLFK